MKKLDFHSLIRQARQARRMTQAELGKLVGCSQGTISNVENGDLDALSDDSLDRLCEVLGIDPSSRKEAILDEALREVETLAFCSCPVCPRGQTFLTDRLAVRPAMFRILAGPHGTFCPACGTPLQTQCSECLTPLVAGAAFCTGCGRPLVEKPPGSKDDVESVRLAAERVKEYGELSSTIESLPATRLRNQKILDQKPTKLGT